MHLYLIIVLITDCVLFAIAALGTAGPDWHYFPVVPLILNLVALLFILGALHA